MFNLICFNLCTHQWNYAHDWDSKHINHAPKVSSWAFLSSFALWPDLLKLSSITYLLSVIIIFLEFNMWDPPQYIYLYCIFHAMWIFWDLYSNYCLLLFLDSIPLYGYVKIFLFIYFLVVIWFFFSNFGLLQIKWLYTSMHRSL